MQKKLVWRDYLYVGSMLFGLSFGTNGARPISKEVVANLGKAKKGPIVKYNSKVKIRA